MYKVLEHLEKFLFVIFRKDKKVKLYMRTAEHNSATLMDLQGIEVIRCGNKPDMESLFVYHVYNMRRHCANPIIPKKMIPTSIFKTIGGHTTNDCLLMLYAQKIPSSQVINSYISRLSKGENPESIMGWLAGWLTSKSGKPSPSQREKISLAKDKLSTRSLFRCRMLTGTSCIHDKKLLTGIFPAGSISSRKIKPQKIRSKISGSIKEPFFRPSKSLILNDDEITSFVLFPSNTDIDAVGFEFGKMPSRVSGFEEGKIE